MNRSGYVHLLTLAVGALAIAVALIILNSTLQESVTREQGVILGKQGQSTE